VKTDLSEGLANALGVYLFCGYLYALQCSILLTPGNSWLTNLALRSASATGLFLTFLEVVLENILPPWIFRVSPFTIALLFLPCVPTLVFLLLRWLLSKSRRMRGIPNHYLDWAIAAMASLLFVIFFGPPIPNW
jgi:hypothetical protein